MPDFNELEQEVIVLKAAWDAIHDMVNFEMFVKPDRIDNMNFIFKTMTHQEHFNALLGDFLSPPSPGLFNLSRAPENGLATDRTFLFHLKHIVDQPSLDPEDIELLRDTVAAFIAWLETVFIVKNVWFPSIKVETNFTMKRIAFIKICGNIAKHSFARMNVDAGKIQDILRENGHEINDDQKFLLIPEFYGWFHRNIFGYHASAIAEFLNNIRWGIHHYLWPTHLASVRRDVTVDPPRISYAMPAHCQRDLAQTMFWNLMNDVGKEPFMPRYRVAEYLKKRY